MQSPDKISKVLKKQMKHSEKPTEGRLPAERYHQIQVGEKFQIMSFLKKVYHIDFYRWSALNASKMIRSIKTGSQQ